MGKIFLAVAKKMRVKHKNLARLQQMALNLLSQEKTAKIGVTNKKLKASWDNDYLVFALD